MPATLLLLLLVYAIIKHLLHHRPDIIPKWRHAVRLRPLAFHLDLLVGFTRWREMNRGNVFVVLLGI